MMPEQSCLAGYTKARLIKIARLLRPWFGRVMQVKKVDVAGREREWLCDTIERILNAEVLEYLDDGMLDLDDGFTTGFTVKVMDPPRQGSGETLEHAIIMRVYDILTIKSKMIGYIDSIGPTGNELENVTLFKEYKNGDEYHLDFDDSIVGGGAYFLSFENTLVKELGKNYSLDVSVGVRTAWAIEGASDALSAVDGNDDAMLDIILAYPEEFAAALAEFHDWVHRFEKEFSSRKLIILGD